jgi:hypothetical protein
MKFGVGNFPLTHAYTGRVSRRVENRPLKPHLMWSVGGRFPFWHSLLNKSRLRPSVSISSRRSHSQINTLSLFLQDSKRLKVSRTVVRKSNTTIMNMKYPMVSKRPSLQVLNSQRQLEKAAQEPDAKEFLRRFKEHALASIGNAYEYVVTVSCGDRSC